MLCNNYINKDLTTDYMDIISVFTKFKTQQDCIKHLENVRWNNKPTCPYCGSDRATKVKDNKHYHCGACNKQYSVTVKTIFHDTKLPLQKWFIAIAIITNAKKGVSSLQLARDLNVNQKTAWRMGMQIRKSMEDAEQLELMTKTVEIDECYIGGKKKKGDKNNDIDDNLPDDWDGNGKPLKRGRGTDKQGIIGAIERETGKIVAKKQDKFAFADLKAFVSQFVDFSKATLYTDDFTGYKPFRKITKHETVNHSRGEYVRDGIIHTNTIEGFWGLFKRSFVGSFHKLSVKHLDRYIQECCWKYNNRDCDMFNMNLFFSVFVA